VPGNSLHFSVTLWQLTDFLFNRDLFCPSAFGQATVEGGFQLLDYNAAWATIKLWCEKVETLKKGPACYLLQLGLIRTFSFVRLHSLI
jgi:hypothetical protein